MKYSWNFNLLYKSDNDPLIDTDIKKSEQTVKKFVNKWKKNDKYTKDPKTLLSLLLESEKLEEGLGILKKPSFYFYLRLSQEQDNAKLKAKSNLIDLKSVELANSIQFIQINISKIPKKDQSKFLRYPGLQDYKHYLEKIFREGEYILSDNEEKIVNIMSKTSYSDWVDMTSELLSKEIVKRGRKTYTIENLLSLISSNKQEDRDFAGKELNKIFKKHSDVAERELNAVLQYKNAQDKLRGFKTPDEQRIVNDDIDSEFIKTLREVVSENFDISKRLYKLVSKILGKKKIEYYERSIEFYKPKQKYTYEKSVEIIKEVYNKLDSQLGKMAQDVIENGQVDVYSKKGKSSGAFCIHNTSLPVYILLNHNDQMGDVTTFAHEMGHGVNFLLAQKHQKVLNSGTPTSTAEVASTFFEDFAFQKVAANLKGKSKFFVLLSKLQSEMATINRQIACYNFELDLHGEFKKKGYLSKKEIGGIFVKNMKAYMGDCVNFDLDSEYWWVYWSHIRRFFYVYSYSSGLLISKALQNMVKENPKDIQKVIKILSMGSVKSPKDIFKDVGIDISKKEFWEKGLKEIRNMLEEVEKIYENIKI